MGVPESRITKATLLLDPSSDFNLLKVSAVRDDIIVDTEKYALISEINNHIVKSYGTVTLSILKSLVKFHVVRSDFPTPANKILGRPNLRQEQAQISLRYNALVTV